MVQGMNKAGLHVLLLALPFLSPGLLSAVIIVAWLQVLLPPLPAATQTVSQPLLLHFQEQGSMTQCTVWYPQGPEGS